MKRRDYLLPMPFVFSGIVNMLLFYMGIGSKGSSVRTVVFIVLGVVYFFLALESMVHKKIYQEKPWKLFLLPLFMGGLYLWAVMTHGLTGMILRRGLRFGVFGLCGYMIGIILMVEKREDKMFLAMEKLSWLMVPAAFAYLRLAIHMGEVYWDRNMGAVTYMALAYTWMPCLFAVALNISRDGFSALEFKVGKKVFRLPILLRILEGLLLWLVIQISFTRGAILGTLLFFTAYPILGFWKGKNKKIKKQMALFSLLIFSLYVGLNFSFVPKNFYGGERMDIFVQSIAAGKIETSERGVLPQEDIDALIEDKDPLHNPVWKEKNLLVEDGTKINIGDRITLYKLAFGEIKKHSKLFGMGPFSYQHKYGLYPLIF